MKITRSDLKSIIKEMLLSESRLAKQQFYQKVRSKFPGVDDLFFVHWIRAYGVSDGEEMVYHLRNKINLFANSKGRDFSANLVDMSGKNISSHKDAWGPVGIVFQGIPTMASARDVEAGDKKSHAGTRAYPRTLGRDENERYTIPATWPKLGYELDDISDPSPYRKAIIDFSKEYPFKNISDEYPYTQDEWIVVPKKIIAVIINEKDGSIDDNELDIEEIIESAEEFCQSQAIPLIVGHDKIRNFFRSLS